MKREVSASEAEPLFASLLPSSAGAPFADAHASRRGVYWPLGMEPDVSRCTGMFSPGRGAAAVSYNKHG